MPCTITDKLGYRASAGTFHALPNRLLYAIPASQTLRVSFAGTYRPLVGVNPNASSAPLLHAVQATTDATGDIEFDPATLMEKRQFEAILTLTFRGGRMPA